MRQQKDRPEKHIQESLLAPFERRVLIWLARRMPPRVNSDHLTVVGLAAMILAGFFYYLSGAHPFFLHLVNASLIINWFGDSLDGTLARHRNKLRPRYGYYVDHITDSLGTLCLLGGLASSGHMNERVACAVLIAYFLLSINSYLAAHALGEFRISFWKFSPTELRILLIVGNLFLMAQPGREISGVGLKLFDVGGLVAVCVMLMVLVSSVFLNTRKLYQLERV